MTDLIGTVGLENILNQAGIDYESQDFEAIYSELEASGNHDRTTKELEKAIYEYFERMELPLEPTVYDYLVLSLRPKDLIATFNWDPLLLQAYRRNSNVKDLPKLAFLHGNVAVGLCITDQRSGPQGARCSVCRQTFSRSRLLYPVREKDYSGPFIDNEWSTLKAYLASAYFLTIFGYSAPLTDIKARNLFLCTWKRNPIREQAEIDLIDTRLKSDLVSSWADFIVREHYGVTKLFRDSYLGLHPRRSCEAFAAAYLMNDPWHDTAFPSFDSLADLQLWVQPLVHEERQHAEDGTLFRPPDAPS